MVRDVHGPTRSDIATMQKIRERREEILDVAAQHGVRNIRLFGSIVRGDATLESDVDLLVDLEPGRSLLDLGAFQMDVQELLGRHVDVVTTPALRHRLRREVIEAAVPL